MADDISLLQEIDEALRADKAYNFWKRYGKLVLAGCVGIVILTAVSAYWKNRLHNEELRHTQLMLKAAVLVANAQYAEAPAILEQSTNWPKSIASLATLQKADILFKAGQRDKAAVALKEVATNPKADEALKDIAALRLHMQTSEKGLGGADAVGRPFAVLAGQIKAAQLLEEGKNKEATDVLKAIIAVSPALSVERERTEELLQLASQDENK